VSASCAYIVGVHTCIYSTYLWHTVFFHLVLFLAICEVSYLFTLSHYSRLECFHWCAV